MHFCKIIRKSNFDYEDWRGDIVFVTPSHSFSEATANAICDMMNDDPRRADDDYFKVVPYDYVLPPKWEP